MSLVSQVNALASRIATQFNTVKSQLASKADLDSGIVRNSELPPRIQSFGNATPRDGDWNNAVDTGWYSYNNGTNAPFGQTGWYTVEVQQLSGNPNYVLQTATAMAVGGGVTPYQTCRRLCDNGTWSAWVASALDASVVHLADVPSVNGTIGGSYSGGLYLITGSVGASQLAGEVKPTGAGGTAGTGTVALRALGSASNQAMPGNRTLNQIAVPIADVAFAGYRAVGLGDPASAQDAATKNYVDNLLAMVGGGHTFYYLASPTLAANTWTDLTLSLSAQPYMVQILGDIGDGYLGPLDLDWRVRYDQGSTSVRIDLRSPIARVASYYSVSVIA